MVDRAAPDFSLAAWEAQREVLAVRLGDAEWSAVAMLYSALERLNQSLASYRVEVGHAIEHLRPIAGPGIVSA